jgi:dUTP pyrophosphatase
VKPARIDMELVNGGKEPVRGSVGAAGYDFYANNEDEVVIEPGQTVLIPLGVKVEIPFGVGLFLWPRSSMDWKGKISKHAGVIDSDYRGECHACLYNRGTEEYVIRRGERVVQGVFQRYELFEFNVVESLDDSDRGAGGFGSTGK